MSNPDILELTSMYGAISFEAPITTTNTFVLSNVLDSNQVYKINDITVTNIDGSTATTVSVFIDRPSTTAHLAKTVTVPPDTTLTIVLKENAIYLEEGDTIVAVAGANDILSVNISYEIIGTSTSFVTTDLALHLDANDINSYDSRENYVSYSNYNAATWSVIPVTGTASLTTGIDDPFNGSKAVRITCNNDGVIVFRVTVPSFTPNGTDQYTVSFYVRSISGTGTIRSDVGDDLNLSYNYTNDLVTNQWVRVTYTAVPTATAKTWIDIIGNFDVNRVMDFYGVQIERRATASVLAETNGSTIIFSTPSAWNNLAYSGFNFTLTNATYYSFVSGPPKAIRFTRTMPPTAKAGGYATAAATGNITAFNYLHSNHTTEIWFKSNDRDPTAHDANENASVLVVYPGYHSGFYYTATALSYQIWGETLGPVYNSTAVSISDTSESVWTQLVAVRNDFDLYLYKNGVLQTSTRIDAGFLNTQPTYIVTDNIRLGSSGLASFTWNASADISILRMYKRALTSDEVLQNFNANKSRFGL